MYSRFEISQLQHFEDFYFMKYKIISAATNILLIYKLFMYSGKQMRDELWTIKDNF